MYELHILMNPNLDILGVYITKDGVMVRKHYSDIFDSVNQKQDYCVRFPDSGVLDLFVANVLFESMLVLV